VVNHDVDVLRVVLMKTGIGCGISRVSILKKRAGIMVGLGWLGVEGGVIFLTIGYVIGLPLLLAGKLFLLASSFLGCRILNIGFWGIDRSITELTLPNTPFG
jgi:hypothetical protein